MTHEPNLERMLLEEQERLRAELPPKVWDGTVRSVTDSFVAEGNGCAVSLPRICSNGRQLRDISRDALRALQDCNHPPVQFVRSGMIVAIVRNEKKRQV